MNPYAVEVASLLARDPSVAVTLVDSANSEHRPPPRVVWHRRLPTNFAPTSPRRQLFLVAWGLCSTLAAALRRHVVVVAWWRFPVEALTLAAVAALGRPVVVVDHNPVPRVQETRATRWARRSLLRHSTVIVVHSDRLRDLVEPALRHKVVVCQHPPYQHTAPPGPSSDSELTQDRNWLAFIGRLRRDKGIHLVLDILRRVPAEQRRRLGLVLCGMGEVPGDLRAGLEALDVALVEHVSRSPTPTETLYRVLRGKPLVLAPYVAATQSGSVILALSLGCRVVAFDQGGLRDVVGPDGLVPTDDLDAFAGVIANDGGGLSRQSVADWADSAAASWSAAVRQAVAWPGDSPGELDARTTRGGDSAR